ncbi:MAG: PTS sugar transporter subunit IIA [Gammaproteobacteria bacterium]|nr:PTS sugar transporter subunit IIA [Gammaproteobacteria bacterium]
MSVGILIITHAKVGDALIDTADKMLGGLPLKVEVMPIPLDCEPDNSVDQALTIISALDEGDGVLVLTDMYGSTPSNVANKLLQQEGIRIVTGVNLPMLIRVLNYPRLDLDELTQKALSGGIDGIMQCKKKDTEA